MRSGILNGPHCVHFLRRTVLRRELCWAFTSSKADVPRPRSRTRFFVGSMYVSHSSSLRKLIPTIHTRLFPLPSGLSVQPHHNVTPRKLDPPCQAILSLREEGNMTRIVERYFEPSPWASLEISDDASTSSSENFTLMEMRCVFLVYGIFTGLSLVAWLFGRFHETKTKLTQQLWWKDGWTCGKVIYIAVKVRKHGVSSSLSSIGRCSIPLGLPYTLVNTVYGMYDSK